MASDPAAAAVNQVTGNDGKGATLKSAASEAPHLNEVERKIVEQVEFYFSNSNLPRDKFLRGKVEENTDGWVDIAIIASFARMKALSTDVSVITTALTKSKELVVSEDRKQLRRLNPLPTDYDPRARSIYIKGLPEDSDIDSLKDFFSGQTEGKGSAICARLYKDKETKKLTGFGFLEFNNEEAAKVVIASAQKTDFVYKDKELEVTARSKKRSNTSEKKGLVYTKDRVIEFKGLSGVQTSREEMKGVFTGLGVDVAFIKFNRGDPEGTIRLKKEATEGASELVAKLINSEAGVKVGTAALELVALTGEQELTYYTEMAAAQANAKRRKKRHRR